MRSLIQEYENKLYDRRNEDTIKRELTPLLDVPDKYDTYILSMDKINMSQMGVKHMNIIDFLLKGDI